MQVFSTSYLKNFMVSNNKRVDTLYCIESIPHPNYNDFIFEKSMDYEVLGINWKNESFVVMNDFGEVTEVSIIDKRFKVEDYIKGHKYPTNFLLGVGMNKMNQWNWFE